MLTPEIGGVKTPIIVGILKKIIAYCSLMFPNELSIHEGFLVVGVMKSEKDGEEKKYSELLFHEVGEYKENGDNKTNYAAKARENIVLLKTKKAVSSRKAKDATAAGAISAGDLILSISTNAHPKMNEALAILLAQTLGWLKYEQTGKIIDAFIEMNK